MPRYDRWGYDRGEGSRYDERFRADRWGFYGGGSRYWGPEPFRPQAPRYGGDFPVSRGYDAPYRGYGRPDDRYGRGGYDRQGGYAGETLARGWGFRNDPYQPEWERPRGRGRGYGRGG